MIDTRAFISFLIEKNVNSFYGVPDSLLKPLCKNFLDLPKNIHQITTNEANAIASSIGHHLATGDIGCAYFQNSGLGNTINPLVSLASKDVYSIPLLLIIGWRGEILENDNQLKDEPQHIQQGRITLNQLKVLNIPYEIISKNDIKWKEKIHKVLNIATTENRPVALVCRKSTFKYSLDSEIKLEVNIKINDKKLFYREEAIKEIITILPHKVPIFSTTGMASRELYEFRKSRNQIPVDFYTVGGMGCASSIALGFIRSSKNTNQVICIDGDGSVLMHMGSLFKIAKQKGFIQIIINNNSHDSVGGQPTGAFEIDFKKLGYSIGFDRCYSIFSKKELEKVLKNALSDINSSSLIELKVRKGNREDLGRPKESPNQNKKTFMKEWSKK